MIAALAGFVVWALTGGMRARRRILRDPWHNPNNDPDWRRFLARHDELQELR
jgi:hypothetical protein